MAINRQLVDGNQALDAQERALNIVELATFSKVISYSRTAGNAAPGMRANEVVTQDVPIGRQPGPLHLEELAVNGDALPIITAQLNAGKLVVFQDNAYVSGIEQMVLGFRSPMPALPSRPFLRQTGSLVLHQPLFPQPPNQVAERLGLGHVAVRFGARAVFNHLQDFHVHEG